MADRFPSIEDLDAGKSEAFGVRRGASEPWFNIPAGETEVRPDSTAQGSFLERERAVLGEDADLFATNDKPGATTVEDGDDDLLGGDDGDFTSAAQPAAENDLDTFESSFPVIDSRNDVRRPLNTVCNY